MEMRDYLMVVESYCAAFDDRTIRSYEAPLTEGWEGLIEGDGCPDTFLFSNPSANEFVDICRSYFDSQSARALVTTQGGLIVWNRSGASWETVRSWLQKEKGVNSHPMKLQLDQNNIEWLDVGSFRSGSQKLSPTFTTDYGMIVNNRFLKDLYRGDMEVLAFESESDHRYGPEHETLFAKIDRDWIRDNVTEDTPLREDEDRFVGWITSSGETIPDGVLMESHVAPEIHVSAQGLEFHATWTEQPSEAALERLAVMIESINEFEAYYIGAMIFPLRQQARAAANSLARG